ncbi:MAG TPA: AIR synthase-related protein, partial [Allosphingosinicella sp.]|nr:AIR synthase-related protein [Allosphingosinicella sp.]
ASARTFSLTAIGEAQGYVPSRSGARPGDHIWVSGSIGDAGAGLALALASIALHPDLLARFRRPIPRLELGQALASLASAMMDVSDGLLIDSCRIAAASGVSVEVELDRVPLSPAFTAWSGSELEHVLAAATSGDDYELLLAAPPAHSEEIRALSDRLNLPLSLIGSIQEGSGLALSWRGDEVPLPERLGFEHRSSV